MRSADKIWTCHRCLRGQPWLVDATAACRRSAPHRSFRSVAPLRAEDSVTNNDNKQDGSNNKEKGEEKEQGAMSRRLSEMAEETMDTGSRADRKLMKDIGFSEELRKQLEERIAQTTFNAENQQALSQANLPKSAGKGTQDIAAAAPWSGTESLHDSTLRMLDDSHKKLRSPSRAPNIPPKISLKPAPKQNMSAADRLASAREKTSIYAFSQQSHLSEKEREQMRKELKERFTPGARAMPTTLQGLATLANERIEDAIARGQFKNIPRGKGKNVERDYNANSPFLDTTEYFMNKIIQKQEIVPPWIEKQQELVKMVNSFRGRLRNDWRRHAARTISSGGGGIEEQVRRAKGYALAEERVNPRSKKVVTLSGISSDGNLTNITVEERIAAGITADDVEQQKKQAPALEITVTETAAEGASTQTTDQLATTATPQPSSPPPPLPDPSPNNTTTPATVLPMPYPFRDASWEKIELAYQTLAIAELNSLTRSYNLMAPKIAQKPYYNLQRELNRCFADVAPTLADEILDRGRKPVVKVAVIGHKEGGVMERFGSEKYHGHVGTVRDEAEEKGYGFKQFWRDLFRKEEEGKQRRQVA